LRNEGNWIGCVFVSSRRRHTSFSRDWSSDVCSSDLSLSRNRALRPTDWVDARRAGSRWEHLFSRHSLPCVDHRGPVPQEGGLTSARSAAGTCATSAQIGRASCREREEIAVCCAFFK